MAVGEVEVLLPVVVGHVVFTGAQVVADVISDRVIGDGLIVNGQSNFPKQRIHGFGVFPGQEFTAWVGPYIDGGAGDIDGARSH